MRVKAILPGFYKKLRKKGEVFDLEDKALFSDKWMERTKEEAVESGLDEKTAGESTLSGLQVGRGRPRKLQGAD